MRKFIYILFIALTIISCKKEDTTPTEKEDTIPTFGGLKILTITKDGGLLTLGSYVYDSGFEKVISKFDENCNLLWEKTDYTWGSTSIPSSHPPEMGTVVDAFEDEENNYTLINKSYDDWAWYHSCLLIKLDNFGNELWSRGIGYHNRRVRNVVQTDKGYAAVVDNTSDLSLDNNELINIDNNGNVLDSKILSELDYHIIVHFAYNSESKSLTIVTGNDTISEYTKFEYTYDGNLISTKKYTVDFYTLNFHPPIGNFSLFSTNTVLLLDDKGMIFHQETKNNGWILARIKENSDSLWTLKSNSDVLDLQKISDTEFLVMGKEEILYMNIDGEVLGSINKSQHDYSYFFENNEFVFQTFVDDDNNYGVTKTPFSDFFSK